MIDFEFGLPTKIIFGRDKENEVGTIINKYGYKKVLVHFGKGSVIRSGLLSRVEKSLKENNIDYILVGGVEANPKASFVKEVLTIAHQQNIDFILAIGGGSVIDSAKSIAVGYYYDGDPFDFNLHKVTPTKALPIGTILTISAAGSEMSSSCVISNEETKIKRGFNSELV
ncbi:MAG: iron-containing alcohol dehydrogenase, partial [Bacilli bacterium]|nr:iron-containing alcohol dehydrogenase [Bacilli bacterium]